jgi:hypothetical protein
MEKYDVTTYKSNIMGNLVGTPDVFTLIHNINITKPFDMVDRNIFSYMRIPDTTLTVKNYICFDFNAKSSSYNDLYKNVTINLAVVCHQDDIKYASGNRHDVLAGVIINKFNWSNLLGLQLELVSDTETIWEKEYHVRLLQFKNSTFNSLQNGVKINGH